jgi:hypothetical protein
MAVKNYIPLDKPMTIPYYNSTLELQSVQTKVTEIDPIQDKSLVQVFFKYQNTD